MFLFKKPLKGTICFEFMHKVICGLYITGITYGLNPLLGIPLMNEGASVEYILFFRYGFAVLLLGAFLLLSGQKFRVTAKQAAVVFMIVTTKR